MSTTNTNRVTFVASIEKPTKNTVRFSEDNPETEPPVCGTIYVQKWAAARVVNGGGRIKVTIEPAPPNN